MNNDRQIYTGYIYCISNTINSKLYIGQTKRPPENRFNCHKTLGKCNLQKSPEHNKVLYKAMKKYGVDNFNFNVFSTVVACSKNELKDELNYLEKQYIKQFNTLMPNGYNMTPGGDMDGCMGLNSRKVAKYNFAGELLNIYDSISEAAMQNNIDVQSICPACTGKVQFAGEFLWRYVDGDSVKKKIEPLSSIRRCRILQIDNEGNIVDEFDSIGHASSFTHINNVQIGDCINHRCHRVTAGGYRWKQVPFDADVSNMNFGKYTVGDSQKKPVNMYDLNKHYLQTFNSIADAMYFCGKNKNSSSGIVACCKGKQQTAYGYKWYYANDTTQPNKDAIKVSIDNRI